jgi:hypothetical protein
LLDSSLIMAQAAIRGEGVALADTPADNSVIEGCGLSAAAGDLRLEPTASSQDRVLAGGGYLPARS